MADLPRARFSQAPLLILAVSLSLGLVLSRYLEVRSHSALAVLALISISLGVLSLRPRMQNALAATCVIAAFFITGLALVKVGKPPAGSDRVSQLYDQGMISAGDPVELTGTLEGQPEPAPQSFYLSLRVEAIRFRGSERRVSGTVLLLAHVHTAQLQSEYNNLQLRYGARIRVMTILDRDEGYRNPGVMPLTEYLDRNGYDATGVIKSPLLVERLDDGPVFLPLAWLFDWREALESEFSRLFSPETAGVLNAALLGNQYNVSAGAAERLRAGGTFHVLVISGFQIALIGGMVLVVVRWFTKRRVLQFLLASIFLWAYTIAVGADASVVRSAVMFTLVALSPVAMRRANTLNGLGAAAISLLVWRPDDLFDPSFQLTFLSVLSIVTIAVPIVNRMQQVGSWRPAHETPYPPLCGRRLRSFCEALFWSERAWRAELATSNIHYRLFKTPWATAFERWGIQRPLRYAATAIIVTASVQAGMLPLLIIYFHRVSLAALVLNIFVGLIIAALSLIALIAVALAQFSRGAALPLIWLTEKSNWLMVHSVDPFNRLGLASLRLPHYHGGLSAIYLVYFLLLGFLVLALFHWKPLRLPRQTDARLFRPRPIRLVTFALALVLVVILLHPFSAARPDGNLHIDYLDVGQGDCALVTMPDGTTLLVDGGGRPNINWTGAENDGEDETFERDVRSIGERVVSEFLWARGLDRIDYILPTHADADHIDGLNDVVRNFQVRAAILARTPATDLEYKRFAMTLNDASVPIQQVGAGDVLRFGDTTAEVVWPPPRAGSDGPYGNNDGLVLRMRHGERTFLFAADIEQTAESALLKQHIDLRSDLVKVPHHGSKTSSTPAFVAATQPRLAIISVGRTSMFGHPNKEVVERWRASGAQVMTTGERGTITAETDGRSLWWWTFVPQRDSPQN